MRWANEDVEGGTPEAITDARVRLGGRLADYDSQYQGQAHQYHADPKQRKRKVLVLSCHGCTVATAGELIGGAGVNIGEQLDPGRGACVISK